MEEETPVISVPEKTPETTAVSKASKDVSLRAPTPPTPSWLNGLSADANNLTRELCAHQVEYDKRFRVESNLHGAQANTFYGITGGKRRDATGVESVKGTMPQEWKKFRHLCFQILYSKDNLAKEESVFTEEDASTRRESNRSLRILDFGCGDGRYLDTYIRLLDEVPGKCVIHVSCLDVSITALRVFYEAAVTRFRDTENECSVKPDPEEQDGEFSMLMFMKGQSSLFLDFIKTETVDSAVAVETVVRAKTDMGNDGKCFDIVLCGWGTLSQIPDVDNTERAALGPHKPFSARKPRQASFLRMFQRISHTMFNLVSTKNNHVKFAAKFEALRTALGEVSQSKDEAKINYIRSKLKLAAFTDGGYYYPVTMPNTPGAEDNESQICHFFFSGVTYREEFCRLHESGFINVNISACNIINFYEITHFPRKRRLNEHLIELIERTRLEEASLFVCKGLRKAYPQRYRCQLHEMNRNWLNKASISHSVDQVARYFISVAWAENSVLLDHLHSAPDEPLQPRSSRAAPRYCTDGTNQTPVGWFCC